MVVQTTTHYHLPNNILHYPSHPLLTKHSSLPFRSCRVRVNSSLFPLLNNNSTRISVVSENDGGEGPIELSPDVPSIFATNDDTNPLQVSASVLLTGAIGVFLFRSIRRRVRRAKELRVRSTGVKSIKEEALDSLKAIGSLSVETKKTPSPVQALLGAITAGVIAVILYKFTITIEAALNRQALSDSFSARQITVTIRTIINGLCYLATFIFGFNSIGLFLYSGQLAFNSPSEDSVVRTIDKNDASSSESTSETPNNTDNNDPDQTS